jgi:hypothetical protein
MLKEEFEELTGIKVTQGLYDRIESAYMQAGITKHSFALLMVKGLDKDNQLLAIALQHIQYLENRLAVAESSSAAWRQTQKASAAFDAFHGRSKQS